MWYQAGRGGDGEQIGGDDKLRDRYDTPSIWLSCGSKPTLSLESFVWLITLLF